MPGRPSFWWTFFALWLVTLFFLSARSLPEIPSPEIPHLDKLLHLAYFTAGAFFLGTSLSLTTRKHLRFLPWSLAVILAIAAIGALDEWHQTTTPGRHGGDFLDWLADFLGACLGTLLAARLPILLRRSQPPS